MNASALDVTIITGMSGAGRSEAAHVLEDLGFFVIDNLPPMLIGKVAELARGSDTPIRYALVVDVRTGDFLARPLAARSTSSTATARTLASCSSTRPTTCSCAATKRAAAGIRSPTATASATASPANARCSSRSRARPTCIVDTSNLNVHELRDRLRELFAEHASESALQVNVVSFGYKHGLPLDVDLVFDCRFLPNPHWVDELRPQTGLDAPVHDYVLAQPGTKEFLAELDTLAHDDAAGLRARGQGVLVDRRRLHRRSSPQCRRRRAARRTPARSRLSRHDAPS